MSQELILTRGIPSAGKSTWAEQYLKRHPQFVNLNRDDLRVMLYGNPYKFTKEREKQVTSVQRNACSAAIDDGKSVIISDTNLNPKTVAMWEHEHGLYKQWGYDVEFSIKNFDCDLDDALERNALRDGGVPPHVIYRMYSQYMEQVHPDWKVEPDDSLPPAIIVDVDGTVANHEGVRSPYDSAKVHLDAPHQDIIDLVNRLAEDHYVIVMTGRDGSAKRATWDWLDKHDVSFNVLHIRREGDTRKDSVIKKELFDKYVRGKVNVKYVIDDRRQVIFMWRALGLRVLDVAGGEF